MTSWDQLGHGRGGSMRGWVLCQGCKWSNKENAQGCDLYGPRHKTQALKTGAGWSHSLPVGSCGNHRQDPVISSCSQDENATISPGLRLHCRRCSPGHMEREGVTTGKDWPSSPWEARSMATWQRSVASPNTKSNK